MARESLVADAEFRLDSQNRLKLVSEHAMFLLYKISSFGFKICVLIVLRFDFNF